MFFLNSSLSIEYFQMSPTKSEFLSGFSWGKMCHFPKHNLTFYCATKAGEPAEFRDKNKHKKPAKKEKFQKLKHGQMFRLSKTGNLRSQ